MQCDRQKWKDEGNWADCLTKIQQQCVSQGDVLAVEISSKVFRMEAVEISCEAQLKIENNLFLALKDSSSCFGNMRVHVMKRLIQLGT